MAGGSHSRYTDVEAAAAAGGMTIVSKTDNYTASAKERVLFDLSAGTSKTLTLPAATGSGDMIAVHLVDTVSFARLTIDGNGAETIRSREGNNTTLVLYVASDHVALQDVASGQWEVTTYDMVPHRASITRDAIQSIANVTEVKVLFDNSDFDNAGIGDVTTNDRVDILRGGLYTVDCSFNIVHNGSSAYVRIYINGVAKDIGLEYVGIVGSVYARVSQTLVLSAGDYLEMYIYQSTGAPANTSVSYESKPKMTVSEEL